MDLLVEHVDVWAASIQDKPGALATVLAELRESGADLQFIIARRAPEAPGKGVVFVTPLQGDREIVAAAQLGFNVTRTVHSVRVMGPDRRGIDAGCRAPPLHGQGPHLATFECGGPRVYSYEELLHALAREADLKRILIPLPFAAWRALAWTAELLPNPPVHPQSCGADAGR